MVYFLSDVHLGYADRAASRRREELLLALLEAITPHVKRLFIVGDLFDYWFEYRSVIPREFFRTVAALERLRMHGVAIEYLVGNHDFGHRNFFEHELGIPVHWQDIERDIGGKRFYIAHGDGKVAGDRGYMILRAILRSRMANALYRWIHPDLGIGLASFSSQTSRRYSAERNYGTTDSLARFAQEKICHDGFDYVVMGHRHRIAFETYSNGMHHGVYVNLGDWLSNPHVGIFDGERLRLEPIENLLGKP